MKTFQFDYVYLIENTFNRSIIEAEDLPRGIGNI